MLLLFELSRRRGGDDPLLATFDVGTFAYEALMLCADADIAERYMSCVGACVLLPALPALKEMFGAKRLRP